MTFEEAMQAIYAGKKVRRQQYPTTTYVLESEGVVAYHLPIKNEDEIEDIGAFGMDILADDWEVVDD